MSERNENLLKRVVKLREFLVKRIETLEEELIGLKALLQFVDELIKEKSFKKLPSPTEIQTFTPKPPSQTQETIIPLSTVDGILLAHLHVKDNVVRVIPAEDIKFNVNTPPFKSFLINKVLNKIQEKDGEAARRGEIGPDEILSYKIEQDGDYIREIEIRNVKPKQIRELKSAIRWTLRRMFEKTQILS